ncbi:pilS cassette [Neisseria meningitidis]|nr:pilS cassette [Neisseria meningitidis]
MTNFRFLFWVFCSCGNDEILSLRNLSEKTETAPPSFPRRRESSLVGTETYRENGFFRFYVLDSYFRGKDEF